MGLCERRHLGLQPSGKPTDNAYAESFNATVQWSASAGIGFSIWTMPVKRSRMADRYNEVRPHSAIGDRAPSSLIHQPRQSRRGTTRGRTFSAKAVQFWDAPNGQPTLLIRG